MQTASAAQKPKEKRPTGDPASMEYMSVETFMKAFDIGLTKSYEMIKSGDLPSILIGRKRLINARAARERFAQLEAK